MANESSNLARLSFEQREGVESLPTQLELRSVSRELKALMWQVYHNMLSNNISRSSGMYGTYYYLSPWDRIFRSWWVEKLFRNVDEFPDVQGFNDILKARITNGTYIEILGITEFIIRRLPSDHGFTRDAARVLERSRSAYRIIEQTVTPISSDEQADAITRALHISANAKAQGSHSHLAAAAAALTSGDWPGSVRESIHAVEVAAKSLEPTADTLGPALAKLQASIGLAPELRKAFGSLYGYTCKDDGARHALVFEGFSKLTEREALFMFGACASFVAYLLSAV